MTPTTRRRLRRAALLLIGSFLLAGGALVARLARGSIPLNFLLPYLEPALVAPDGSFHASLTTVALAWDRRERRPELRATGVRVVGRGGTPVAEVPAIAVRLALRPLLEGRIVPAEIVVDDARLTVVQRADGTLDLGMAAAAGGPEHVDVGAIFDGFEAGGAAAETSLRRVSARGAELALVDEQSGRTWRLTGVDVAFETGAGGLVATMEGRLEAAPYSVPLRATIRHHRDRDERTVTVGFRGLRPEMIGDLPVWRGDPAAAQALGTLQMPLDGRIVTRVGADLRPVAARGHLRGGAGTLRPLLATLEPIAVTSLRLRVTLDVATRRLEVRPLALALGAARARMVGGLTWAADGGVTVDARTSATDLPFDTIGSWWPTGAAPDAREWVVERRTGGILRTASLELHAGVEGGSPKATLRLGPGGGRFEGAALRFDDRLPPLTDLAGSIAVDDRGWTIHASRGRLETVALTGGSCALPIRRGQLSGVHVTAAVRGAVPDALAILDRGPLPIARSLGVAPGDVAGAVTAHLAIEVPTAGPAGRPAITGNARLTDVATERIAGGFPLTDGDVSLRFGAGRVEATGTARIAGTPVAFDWSETSAAPAAPARRITVSGRLDAAARRRVGIDLAPWLDGPVGVEARLATSRGDGDLDVRARLDDATIATGIPRVAKPAGVPGHADAHLTLRGNVVTGVDRLVLDAAPTTVTGSATRGVDGWDAVRLDARMAGAAPGSRPARCTLAITREAPGHRVQLASDDAGALFGALSGSNGLRGGRLVLDGTAAPSAAGLDVRTSLDVRDVVVVASSVLRRIATLGSLSGIERALTGGGIAFDRIAAAIDYREPTVTVTDGIADGSALAVALDGTIDRPSATANLRGTLIPSYYGLNRAPARIPVIGGLLGRGDAKGVQGIDFTATGPLADPEVRVRPMSAIAPGVLRDLVRKLRR